MLERNQHGQHYQTKGACDFVNYRLFDTFTADIARERRRFQKSIAVFMMMGIDVEALKNA